MLNTRLNCTRFPAITAGQYQNRNHRLSSDEKSPIAGNLSKCHLSTTFENPPLFTTRALGYTPFANPQKHYVVGDVNRNYAQAIPRRIYQTRKAPEYLWREETADGKRIRHTQVIGTVDQYPTKELASKAVNGLRARVNEECYRLQLRCVFLADVIDHFLDTVLHNESDPYAESTKQITPATINTWILPRWGSTNIRDVRVKAFRDWLRNLRRKDGQPLADSTKAKIRNIARRLFSHAIECEWLEQGKNVIKLVKQSAMRQKEPDPFEPEEVQRLLNTLKSPYREMVLLVLFFGLRRSELFALQWWDFDSERNKLSVRRTIYGGKLGKCKTKASRASLPMPRSVAVTLIVWRKFTAYKRESDFLFPSIQAKGMTALDHKDPMEVIQTAAKLVGITKRVHWHAFRYTYGSWLTANGADIGVVHELMRHRFCSHNSAVLYQSAKEAKTNGAGRHRKATLSWR